VILEPRYDGPPIVSIDGEPGDQLAPLTRQRRRLEATLADLTEQQWLAPSRCEDWTVRDVVAHLAGVNRFWHASVRAGLAGTPTRFLVSFDPATTPPLMVEQMRAMTSAEVLDAFATSNDAFLGAVADLADEQWSMLAESPPGHVPIRLLAQHALWDSWVHERDIAVPLGIPAAAEPDELRSCLQYSAALSPAFGVAMQELSEGLYAIESDEPDVRVLIEITDSVTLRDQPAPAGTPTLRGRTVDLVEALSLRAPLPESAPLDWATLLQGLATAFTRV